MNNEDNKIDLDRFHKAIAAIVTGANYDPRRDMHYIDPKTIKNWQNLNSYWTPKAVSSICPHCDALTTFPLTAGAVDQSSKAMDLDSICPNCEQKVSFFAIDCARCDRQENPDIKAGSIWMYPEPQKKRKILIDKNLLKFEIFDAYQESIECFNDKRWRATVTECRRALEGITHDLFDEGERKLLKTLGEGKHSTNIPDTLYSPILELTKAIRLGGLSGAHFNLQRPADKEIAERVLDHTEYLLKYFYELPSSVQSLKAIIEKFESPI